MTRKFKAALWHWHLRRRLHRIAAVRQGNLVIPDGLDGWVHLEWLLLRPDGVHVLGTLEGAGQLIAGDLLPEWTLVGKRRFVFPSPLPELERKLAAVRLLAGDVPVSGLLVMNDGLRLARSHPATVVSLSELPMRLQPLPAGAAIPPDYAQSWDRLTAASRHLSSER